jgi:hypothetical protein
MRPFDPKLLVAPLALLLACGAVPAVAGPSNDDCLGCHSDAVDAKAFEASIHGQLSLSCTDCHADLADVTDFPHADKLQPAGCTTCHGDAVAAYAKGAHAKAREAGKTVAATCVDCHGKHDILPKSDPASRTYVFAIPQTCGRCHGEKAKEYGIHEGDVLAAYVKSVHGKGLVSSGLAVSAECTDCHGSHAILPKSDPDSTVNKLKAPATCGKCHQGIEPIYAKSVHGRKLAAGDLKAPACFDCHTAHGIAQTGTERWKLEVLEECGGCHEQSLTTYRDTFHGQVSKLGFGRVATCAGCHGSHDILPGADPASRVSPQRRQETCNTCHPGTNANFAMYDPHADIHDKDRNAVLYWTGVFMKGLLFGVFAFFLTHTALWLSREVIDRAKGGSRHS